MTPRRLEALLATEVASTLAMLLIKASPRTEVVSVLLRMVPRLFRALIACFAIMAEFGNDGVSGIGKSGCCEIVYIHCY